MSCISIGQSQCELCGIDQSMRFVSVFEAGRVKMAGSINTRRWPRRTGEQAVFDLYEISENTSIKIVVVTFSDTILSGNHQCNLVQQGERIVGRGCLAIECKVVKSICYWISLNDLETRSKLDVRIAGNKGTSAQNPLFSPSPIWSGDLFGCAAENKRCPPGNQTSM